MPARDTRLSLAPPGENTLFLPAGAVFASRQPHIVTTVLGSCVSVCLWDPRRRAGGINHYRHPDGDHYADFLSGPRAIAHLIQRMDRLGCERQHLQALLFGGARVLDAFTGVSHIGEANIAVAERILDRDRITVVYRHVGGARGRKLFFRTDTGGHAIKLLGTSALGSNTPTTRRRGRE